MRSLLILIFCCLPLAIVTANDIQPTATSYSTARNGKPYIDNQGDSVELSIPGVKALEVTIKGSSEKKYDALRIYYHKKSRHHEFSGDIEDTRLIIPDDTILVTFNSDNKTVAGKGFEVTVSSVSPLTHFKRIKSSIDTIVEQIATSGADDAKNQVNNSLDVFQTINQAITTGQAAPLVAEQIIQGLQKVATAYASIGSIRVPMQKHTEQRFQELERLLKDTQEMLDELQYRQQDDETKYQDYDKALKQEADSIQRKMLEASLKGQESLIESLRIQADIWHKFHGLQIQLQERLRVYASHLDLLLYILEVNAKVYREAAFAMQMQHDVKLAAQALQGLTELKSVLLDIEQSWQAVEAIQQQIKTIHEQG